MGRGRGVESSATADPPNIQRDEPTPREVRRMDGPHRSPGYDPRLAGRRVTSVEAAFGLAVVAAMAALLADGVGHLAKAFQRLDPDRRSKSEASATDAADAAVKTQRQLERVYRQAASALLEVQDLREIMGRRELYRRVSRISETVTEAADRVWYATVKEG
jgi:glutamine synthetase adenylyltransferase